MSNGAELMALLGVGHGGALSGSVELATQSFRSECRMTEVVGLVKVQLSGRRTVVCLLALAVGLGLAGCSGDSSDSKPLPEQSAADTASATPRERKHAEALVAYRAMWRDLAEAAKTSNASSPQLDDHASGAALDLLEQRLDSAKKEEVVLKGTLRLHPVIASGSDREVEVRDCVDSTKWLVYRLNDELRDNVPGGHSKAEASVAFDGAGWKVNELVLYRSGTC